MVTEFMIASVKVCKGQAGGWHIAHQEFDHSPEAVQLLRRGPYAALTAAARGAVGPGGRWAVVLHVCPLRL